MSSEKKDETNEEIIERVKTTLKENPNSLNLMKKGDYSVHILIEEIKNLCCIKENSLPLPMVKITCLNQIKRTAKPPNDCDGFVFNEHIYFDGIDLSADTLDSSKIIIEAYDYHNFEKQYYFGIQEFDFEYIYSKENHCIKNLWVALANPEAKDITKINGYLKLSINIASTEDEKVELNPDPNYESDFMLPPQIKTVYKQLQISIFRGEEFPDMENSFGDEKKTNRRCTGSVEVKYLGVIKSTHSIKMEKEIIIWNEMIEIPVPEPIVSQKVIFTVKDRDKYVVGSFALNISDIIEKKYEQLSCVNIYGTLKNHDESKAGKMMNNNGEVGSRWKGRVYLKINYKNCEYPVAGVHKLKNEELLENEVKINRKYLWTLHAKLYSVSFLPKETGTYGVKIWVQEKNHDFNAKKASNNKIDWNLYTTISFNTFNQTLEELPDLIIYLTQSDKEICFQRVKLSNFHLSDSTFVIKLFPEPCIGAVKEIFLSGIVKIKLKLVSKLDDPSKCDTSDFKDGDETGGGAVLAGIDSVLSGGSQSSNIQNVDDLEDLLDKNENNDKVPEEPKKSEFKFYRVVACIYMTRYLIAGDSNGLSDPYCRIQINDKIQETSVRNQCVNGIWNETLVFDYISFDFKDESTWPVMLLTVMDKDFGGYDDMLGYSYLWLKDTNYAHNTLNDKLLPKWHQLYLKKSNKAQGQILMSFYIFEEDEEHKDLYKRIKIAPETELYNFEINTLGLRGLKPLSFIKVKKPYISFDLNSINVSATNGENLPPVQSLPSETGPDPNIPSVIKFSIKLPTKEIFIPEFQCNVYDHVLGGLSKRILGIFLIDLKQIIKETKRIYDMEENEAKEVYKELLEKRNKNNLINNNMIENGMSEKDNLNSINDINTSSKQDTNMLGFSNDLSSPLMADSYENNNNMINNTNLLNKFTTFLCHNPSDLNVIYKGIIDNNLIEKEKNNSEYFVIKPSFTQYSLPKRLKNKVQENQKMNENGQSDSMQELDTKKVHEKEKDENENLVENLKSVPNPDLYFPIGYNKNDNPLKLKEKNKKENLLGEVTIDDDEKEGLIKKTEKKITNNKKHYRRIYRKELEKVKELSSGAPFIKCTLMRNKYEDSLSSLTSLYEGIKDENNKIIKEFKPKKKEQQSTKLRAGRKKIDNLSMKYIENEEELRISKGKTFDLDKDYGYFKGLIRIAEKNEYDKHKEFINNMANNFGGKLPEELSFLNAFDDFCKSVLVKKSVIVRIYVLELNNLERKDTFSESDPYIKILIGDKLLVDEKKKYIKNTKNCKWYQYYDLLIELPGSSKLRLQVLDHDQLFSDDLIGETSIDIEDRYFDNRWQSLENKPIEVRKLYHPDYEKSQGEVIMWVEMFEKNADSIKIEPWNIEPEPISTLQMRLIIYETYEMENMDVEDTSDIYVTAYINPKEKFQTDIHYRCSNGQASFNWRMLIPVELPRNNFDLTLQVFDSDLFSKDDYICGARLNLAQIINDVNVLDIPLKLSSDYVSALPEERKNALSSNIQFVGKDEDEEGVKFWVMMRKNDDEKDEKEKKKSRVLCSLEILPEWYSEMHPVGKGREEPNMNPYLPPPVGRIKFTLNPFKMLNQLTGPKFRKKCYKIVCLICLTVYLLFAIPYIVYFISGEIFNPFNY